MSEMLDEIFERYGKAEMAEFDTRFSPEKKAELQHCLFEDKFIPDLSTAGVNISESNYMDGVKFRFAGGGWMIVRFSGTEPLLRIFCEAEDREKAQKIIDCTAAQLGL